MSSHRPVLSVKDPVKQSAVTRVPLSCVLSLGLVISFHSHSTPLHMTFPEQWRRWAKGFPSRTQGWWMLSRPTQSYRTQIPGLKASQQVPEKFKTGQLNKRSDNVPSHEWNMVNGFWFYLPLRLLNICRSFVLCSSYNICLNILDNILNSQFLKTKSHF